MIQVQNITQVIGAVLVAVFSGVLTAVLLIDLRVEIGGQVPLGRRLHHWARRNPALVCGLFAVWGALLAHFFWQWQS